MPPIKSYRKDGAPSREAKIQRRLRPDNNQATNMRQFIISVDPADAIDFTAISVTEVISRRAAWLHVLDHPDEKPPLIETTIEGDFPKQGGSILRGDEVHLLRVGHMERFNGLGYQEIIRRVSALRHRPEFNGCRVETIIDATGVGRPILEMFKRAALNPVGIVITSGMEARYDQPSRTWMTPKKLLIQSVDAAMHRGILQIQGDLEEAGNLQYELNDFRYRISEDTGYETWGARVGSHDDMVLSVALASWFAMVPSRAGAAFTYRI